MGNTVLMMNHSGLFLITFGAIADATIKLLGDFVFTAWRVSHCGDFNFLMGSFEMLS